MRPLLLLYMAFFCLTGCSDQEKYNPKAIDRNFRGVELMQREALDSALIIFQEAIRLDPSYPLPHTNRAGVFLRQKEWDRAHNELQMALQKKPDFAEAWGFAGMLYDFRGDAVSASKHYSRAIDLYETTMTTSKDNMEIFNARSNRAILLFLAGRGRRPHRVGGLKGSTT